MTVYVELEHERFPGMELRTEAEAGVDLETGARWFGTRLRYRTRPARRWEHLILVDVHPFDRDAIATALELYLAGKADRAAS